MQFSAKDISPATAYKLLVSTVVPRPIAFVTTQSAGGVTNAAPFSFFNAMGSEPPVVNLGFQPGEAGALKDTPRNILDTGEFVVNIVDEALADQMNKAAAALPFGQSEIVHADIGTRGSVSVAPPRIAAAPVSMECRLFHDLELPGGGHIITGEVVEFHLRDDLIDSLEPLRINLDKLGAISRLSGPLYGRITDQFRLTRPK